MQFDLAADELEKLGIKASGEAKELLTTISGFSGPKSRAVRKIAQRLVSTNEAVVEAIGKIPGSKERKERAIVEEQQQKKGSELLDKAEISRFSKCAALIKRVFDQDWGVSQDFAFALLRQAIVGDCTGPLVECDDCGGIAINGFLKYSDEQGGYISGLEYESYGECNDFGFLCYDCLDNEKLE